MMWFWSVYAEIEIRIGGYIQMQIWLDI